MSRKRFQLGSLELQIISQQRIQTMLLDNLCMKGSIHQVNCLWMFPTTPQGTPKRAIRAIDLLHTANKKTLKRLYREKDRTNTILSLMPVQAVPLQRQSCSTNSRSTTCATTLQTWKIGSSLQTNLQITATLDSKTCHFHQIKTCREQMPVRGTMRVWYLSQ